MFYNLERELQHDLQQIVFNYELNKKTNGFLRREFAVGQFIPDLITVKFDYFPKINRWPTSWSGNYSFIISLLRIHHSLTIEEIAALYFCQPEKIYSLLDKLIKHNIINYEDNVYSLSLDYLYMKAEVISFEAKLFRWKEALNQAITYKSFSDKVIVAMDPEGIPKHPLSLELFEKNGIGLISVKKNKIKWIIYPKKNHNFNEEYDYIITSTLVPRRQMFWSRLKAENALFHA